MKQKTEALESKVKKPKAVKDLPSISDIMKGNKKFTAMILNKEEDADFAFPYRIPFQHVGLQSTTGGIIGGKMAEISGDSQTGKSFLLYELIAETQKMGGYAMLFDLEKAFEQAFAKICGINMGNGTLAIETNPDITYFFSASMSFITTIREYEKLHKLPQSPILIGLDSFPGLQTKVDLANMESGKDPRGYAAMQKNAAFSQQIDKLIHFLEENSATLVLLNQTRKDHTIEFGDKTVTPGENTIKFWCTQRIRGKLSKKLVRVVKSLEYKNGTKETIGSSVIWETIKNRSVKPFQKVLVKFRYSSGLEKHSGLDELLFQRNKITLATTTIAKDGTKVGKALKGFKLADKDDSPFYYNIQELIEANPSLMTPAWTGTYDDGEGVEDGPDEAGDGEE